MVSRTIFRAVVCYIVLRQLCLNYVVVRNMFQQNESHVTVKRLYGNQTLNVFNFCSVYFYLCFYLGYYYNMNMVLVAERNNSMNMKQFIVCGKYLLFVSFSTLVFVKGVL